METLNLGIDGLDEIVQIGRGGSSRVFRAKQTDLDREVALKVLNAGNEATLTRRFDRERKTMGRLSLHQGIVPIYSSGITDHGEPYLVMPYYSMGSLQDRMTEGPVEWRDAATVILASANTMAEAHAAGVVHLDLKPANVLLAADGAPRIADFGIAKLMNDQASTTKSTGQSFTPTYSAPEILLGSEATPAADVYGLAATLWALIAGSAPFKSPDGDNSVMAVVGRVVHQPIDDLRHLAPDAVCSTIEIAMAKDPNDRYPSAGAFARALTAALERSDTPAAGLVPPAPVSPLDAVPTTASTTILDAADDGPPLAASRFTAPIPPRLMPLKPAPVVPDFVERYGVPVAMVGGAALLGLVLFFGLRAIGGDSDTASDTSAAEANATTSTRPLAGAGGAGRQTTTSAAEEEEQDDKAQLAPASPTETSEATTTSSSSTTSEATTTTTEATTTSSSSTSTSTTSTTTTTPAVLPSPQNPTVVAAQVQGQPGARIEWSAPGSGTVTGYTVFRDGDEIAETGRGKLFLLDAPGPGTHSYQIRAEGTPAPSALSPAVTITIAAAGKLDPPQNPQQNVADDGTVTLTWSAPPASSGTVENYQVNRAGIQPVLIPAGQPLTFSEQLSPGDYSYTIRALGQPADSDPVVVNVTVEVVIAPGNSR